MPMIDIPYARSAPYDNSDYVARMADLMLRRGQLDADAARAAGNARAQMWTNAGNVAMSTLSQIGAARDAERQRAILLQQQQFENAMKQRDYDLRVREVDEASASRQQQQQWQQQQYRDRLAAEDVENVRPGTQIPFDQAQRRFGGTPAWHRGSVTAAQDAQPAWQGEQPMDDSMPDAGPAVAATPAMWERVPNASERLAMDNFSAQQQERERRAARDIIEDGEKLEERRERQENFERTLNQQERHFNAQQSPSERLSDGGLDLAATTYRITGRMPALGMGKDGDRKRVINRAAEQGAALGQSPAMIMQAQAAYKADSAALARMTTARAAAHAFESKALEQSKLVAQLSKQVPRSEYPAINGLLVQGKILAGDTKAHLLNNALLTFTSEYAKIMAGGTGSAAPSTDSAQAHARELISSALSNGTLQETVTQMQREMRWTMDGYNATIGLISESLGGGRAQWNESDRQEGGSFFDRQQ